MLPPLYQSLEDKFSVRNITFPSQGNAFMREMGSCNGLIVLGQWCSGGYENLSVWNVSTRFFRKIPKLSFKLESTPFEAVPDVNLVARGFRYYGSHGLGYVSETDDYKLVFIIPAGPAIDDLLEVHIFSLRANIWRVITAPCSSWRGWYNRQGTFSNGAIHDRRNEGSDQVIYAFDLANEKFRKVPLPPVLLQNEDSTNLIEIETRVHLGGYLSISSQKYCVPKGNEIWAMTVYGVHESWVRLFQFDVHDLPDVSTACHFARHLCFVTESNTMVIRADKELCWIECGNKEKPFCSGRYKLEDVHPENPRCSFYFHATSYDETLVAIAE